ncbi:MAG: FHA domain-containing protein [Acidimicrobiia bacterium]
MIRCPDCRHENPDGLEFCAACGAPLVNGETTLVHAVVAPHVAISPAQQQLVADVPAGIGVLVVERGPLAGSRFLLEREQTRIGRHPDSDVYLDDITVSRRHAAIVQEDAGYRLRDVGSLNGTYLNSARVDELTLRPGDTLQIGRFYLLFLTGLESA